MNQKTTRFNQDAFVTHDALPGNVSPALSNDITSSGVRTEALHITSYTAGDTSGKPDSGLPDVSEATTPKRISRKYIPLQSNSGKAQDAVFPQNSDESEFVWKPQGFQHDTFVSVKDTKPIQTVITQEKGGPSKEVMGLLKQLGHSGAAEVAKAAPAIVNNAIQEKSIVVNMSPTNLTNVEFNNYISATGIDNRTYSQNTYNIQSDTVVNPSAVFVSTSQRARGEQGVVGRANTNNSNEAPIHKASADKVASNQYAQTRDRDVYQTHNEHIDENSIQTNSHDIEPNSVSSTKIASEPHIARTTHSAAKRASEVPIVSNQQPSKAYSKFTDSANEHSDTKDTTSTVFTQSDSDIYEQVRSILGENKQDWKQVIKAAKLTINNSGTATSPAGTGNSTLANQEVQMEQVIQKVLSQEANNRAELEHVLTHKFSTELTNMQQSMNQKIKDLRETFRNFMMR